MFTLFPVFQVKFFPGVCSTTKHIHYYYTGLLNNYVVINMKVELGRRLTGLRGSGSLPNL